MTGLPEDMKSVVRRWNPSGLDALARLEVPAEACVYVTGPPGSGTSSVVDELASRVPMATVDGIAQAAVVVVVLDASNPLGRSALETLRSALESTPVLMVINKIDAYRQWRDVLTADAAMIEEYVPRAVDCTLWPVSAKIAALARTAPGGDLGMHSGFDALSAALTAALDVDLTRVAEYKYAAAVFDAAAGARRAIVDAARAATSAGSTAELRSKRARLTADRDSARTERAALLRSRLQLTRVELVHLVSEEMRVLGASVRAEIDSKSRAGLRHLPSHVESSIQSVAERIDAAVTAKLDALNHDSGLDARYCAVGDVGVTSPELPRRRRGLEDKAAVLVGASAGVGLGRLAVAPLTLVPSLDIASIPITLVLGGLSAWGLSRSRGLAADRASMKSWAVDAHAHARSVLEQRVLTRMLDAETALGAAVTAAVAAASSIMDSEIARVEGELRVAADKRSSLLAACDRDLAALERGLEHVRFGAGRTRSGATGNRSAG